MFLKLTNFKKYTNRSFTFPDDLITLISAPSGSGKSTIFDAIKFAIWGNRDSDVISFGKNRCEVVFVFKQFKFVRTKNPNTFNFFINDVLVENKIDVLKYFPQSVYNFLNLSSGKQLEFLESVVANNFNVSSVLDRLKNASIEYSKKVSDLESETLFLEKFSASLPPFSESLEKPREPEKKYTQEEILENIEKLQRDIIFIENHKDALQLYNDELFNLEKRFKKHFCEGNIYEANVKDLEERLDQLVFQKNENTVLKTQLGEINKRIKGFDTSELETKKQIFNDQKEKQILCKNITQKQNLQKKGLKEPNVSLQQMVETVEKYEKEAREQQQTSECYVCPCCSTRLKFLDNKLQKLHEPSKDYEIFKKILSLESEKPKNVLSNAEYNSLSTWIVGAEKAKSQLENKKALEDQIKTFVNTDEEKTIKHIKKTLDFHKNLTDLLNKKPLLDPSLENLNVECLKSKVGEFKLLLSEISEYEKSLAAWEENKNRREKKQEMVVKILETKEARKKALEIYGCIEKSIRFVQESQCESLRLLVDIINNEAKKMCAVFLPQISIELKNYKTIVSTKNIKNVLSFCIKNDGFQARMSTLSSGEFARASLIFDLVLFNILNTEAPLLLDEIASNLDSKIASVIFEHIKSIFPSKTILLIAHQISDETECCFSNVLKLD